MLYWPEASVTTVRSAGPTAWTVAPAIGPPPPEAETVPSRVPVGPRGAAVTAANALRRPSPQTLLFSAVPPQERSDMLSAVESSNARVAAMSPMIDGAADQISATVAAPCG